MRKPQQAAILAGAFLGPFSGQSLAVILPQFAASFDITLGQAALTMSFYLFPFATMMLFSTWLVRRVSPTKVVITAYTVIFCAALVLIFTPYWWLFLVAFAVAGSANAFTMPLLQIILKRTTPPENLGSAMGTYSAMQSLGMFSAPLVAGLSSLVTWRLTYVLVALVALYIIVVKVPHLPAEDTGAGQPRGGRMIGVRPLIHMISSFSIGFSLIGLAFLIALHAGDVFGTGPVGTGLVVMTGGLVSFFLSRRVGAASDRVGARPVLLTGFGVSIVMLLLIPVLPSVWLLAAAWGGAILGAQGIQVMVNLLVLRSPNGTYILSTVQAFRFFGSSLTPVVLLAIYQGHVGWAFWLPAVVLSLAFLLQAAVGARSRVRGT